MKLFKTEEEKVKTILTKHYPELYNLTKEEIAQIKINLNNIEWDKKEKQCGQYLGIGISNGVRDMFYSPTKTEMNMM